MMNQQSKHEIEYQRQLNSYKRYNIYIDEYIDSSTISPLRTYWISKIIDLLPKNMKIKKSQVVARLINQMVDEIKNN